MKWCRIPTFIILSLLLIGSGIVPIPDLFPLTQEAHADGTRRSATQRQTTRVKKTQQTQQTKAKRSRPQVRTARSPTVKKNTTLHRQPTQVKKTRQTPKAKTKRPQLGIGTTRNQIVKKSTRPAIRNIPKKSSSPRKNHDIYIKNIDKSTARGIKEGKGFRRINEKNSLRIRDHHVVAYGNKAFLELKVSKGRRESLKNDFLNKQAVTVKLTKNIVVYRRYDGKNSERSSDWYSARPYKTASSARNALALPPLNKANKHGWYTIPKDSIILVGKASPKSEWGKYARGGGIQIYVIEYAGK